MNIKTRNLLLKIYQDEIQRTLGWKVQAGYSKRKVTITGIILITPHTFTLTGLVGAITKLRKKPARA